MISNNPICVQCGVEYGRPLEELDGCPICQEERQYVRWDGQAWTTLQEMRAEHVNELRPEGPGLVGIGTEPKFAIGQRALLVQTPAGNVLWDCITYLDDDTIAAVRDLGGVNAIALSHPHFYSTMMTWSRAFGDIPVYVHHSDQEWVPPHQARDNVVFWEGDRREIAPGITLVNAGIHFRGGTVLHWRDGAEGQGALLTGDVFMVVMDRAHVSFMYSYPNLIPERPAVIRRALDLVADLPFEHMYGGWWRRHIIGDAKGALQRSAERYLGRISSPD